jgi:hypothetical protein
MKELVNAPPLGRLSRPLWLKVTEQAITYFQCIPVIKVLDERQGIHRGMLASASEDVKSRA